jgi:parallel beta-helix repeat protein
MPGAPNDGIITAGFVNGVATPGDHVTITDDIVKNNVGSGIDLNSTSYPTAINNFVHVTHPTGSFPTYP